MRYIHCGLTWGSRASDNTTLKCEERPFKHSRGVESGSTSIVNQPRDQQLQQRSSSWVAKKSAWLKSHGKKRNLKIYLDAKRYWIVAHFPISLWALPIARRPISHWKWIFLLPGWKIDISIEELIAVRWVYYMDSSTAILFIHTHGLALLFNPIIVMVGPSKKKELKPECALINK